MNIFIMKDEIPKEFSKPVGNLLFQAYDSEQGDVARISDGRWMGAGWQGHTKEEDVFYSLRIGSPIYKKNEAMFAEGYMPQVPEGFSSPVKGKLLILANAEDGKDIATNFDGEWDIDNWIGSDANSLYSLRIGSDIYEKNKAMFDDEESTGHPHAELMLEYAKDWAETQTPWELWEMKPDEFDVWIPIKGGHPFWREHLLYRRIPEPVKTININGFEVPKPLRKEPNYGDECYTLGALNNATKFLWQGSALEIKRFQLGLLHSTSEAATIHMKAITSFTALPDD